MDMMKIDDKDWEPYDAVKHQKYRDKGSIVKVGVDASEETHGSLTLQSDFDETDINLILQRYARTGVLPPAKGEGSFGDFSDLPDFREAMDMVNKGNDAFMQLDARIRAYFENRPELFLDAINDPSRRDELVAIGLFVKPGEEAVALDDEAVKKAAAEKAAAEAADKPPVKP